MFRWCEHKEFLSNRNESSMCLITSISFRTRVTQIYDTIIQIIRMHYTIYKELKNNYANHSKASNVILNALIFANVCQFHLHFNSKLEK
jgi:hypothetical protein